MKTKKEQMDQQIYHRMISEINAIGVVVVVVVAINIIMAADEEENSTA